MSERGSTSSDHRRRFNSSRTKRKLRDTVRSCPALSSSHDDDDDLGSEGDRMVVNVGGTRHECLVSTLMSKPRTRLCALATRHSRGIGKQEYFFDRHPGVFSTVLDYYRTGELHVPLDVCGAVVKRELDWWQVDDGLIEPCCWIKYSKYIDTQKTLADFNDSERKDAEEFEQLQGLTGWKAAQAGVWMVLDHPRTSRLAMGYAVTSFIFVCISITGFCAETLPSLSDVRNVTGSCDGNQNKSDSLQVTHPVLAYLDYMCTAFFTLELIVRIIFAPNKWNFFTSPMNIIDILALLPLYVERILEITDDMNCLRSHRAVIETIFILRIIRIFRIFHLLKHYKALKILIHAIKASTQELLMLSIFLFICMLIFSTLMYYCERSIEEKLRSFSTIPIGFYWAIITMTTVGYGDVHPDNPAGYLVGSVCAITGVLLIALTIPVISNNFAMFYLHARTREQIANKDGLPRIGGSLRWRKRNKKRATNGKLHEMELIEGKDENEEML